MSTSQMEKKKENSTENNINPTAIAIATNPLHTHCQCVLCNVEAIVANHTHRQYT